MMAVGAGVDCLVCDGGLYKHDTKAYLWQLATCSNVSAPGTNVKQTCHLMYTVETALL